MRNKTGWEVVLWILLLLAGTEFLLRGPVRFARNRDLNDFMPPYIQSSVWMRGADPYSSMNLVRFWPHSAPRPDFLAKDLADGSLVYKQGMPTAYPLTCFLILAPLAVLPWHVAQALWLAISILACAATAASLLSLTGLRRSPHLEYLFLAFALALAPFHTGLAAGSIVIVAVGLIASSIWAAGRQHSSLAGILIGLAVGLKPQIGLPFLFYYCVRRRWGVSATAIGLVAMLFVVAIFRLRIGGATWMQSYLYDNKVLFSSGSLGDFTELNPIRFGLVNLQVPFYAILGNRQWANIAALLAALTMGIAWLFLVNRGASNRNRNELLELSAIAVISLLPIYHRPYDASLLILPLAWSFAVLSGRLKLLARGSLALILPFLVPGGSALEKLQRTGRLSALQHSHLWTETAMPHQSWCLFFLSWVLLLALWLAGARPAEEAAEKVVAGAGSSPRAVKRGHIWNDLRHD